THSASSISWAFPLPRKPRITVRTREGFMNKRTLALAGLIALAAASRLLQHINIAPITAIAVFGAIQFQSRRAAVLASLAALLSTDLLKELLYENGLAVHPGIYGGMWYVFGGAEM